MTEMGGGWKGKIWGRTMLGTRDENTLHRTGGFLVFLVIISAFKSEEQPVLLQEMVRNQDASEKI